MSKIKWDDPDKRFFETGVDHGTLYVMKEGKYGDAVAWNGLTSVASNPSGAEDSPYYADNIKYFNMRSAESYGLTIDCYSYPDEFKECNGEIEAAEGMTFGQQNRSNFGFSYRTKVGNASEGQDYGFKIHLVYGASVSPSSMTYNTVNESPEPGEMSYEATTTPVDVPGKAANGKPYKPVSEIVFESRKMSPEKLKLLEDTLYGTNADNSDPDNPIEGTTGRLPLPEELMTMMAAG